VLREIDFLLEICDLLLAFLICGVKLLEYRYVQVWIIAKRWKQSPVGWFLYSRGHQPFWNWELLLGTDSCEGLPVWYTHFRHKNLLNLSSIMLSRKIKDIHPCQDI